MSSLRTADKIQMGSAAWMEKHRDAPLNKQLVSVQGPFWALALPGVNAQKLIFTTRSDMACMGEKATLLLCHAQTNRNFAFRARPELRACPIHTSLQFCTEIMLSRFCSKSSP